jgi:catechol 2,3-dioxygenase-like lactoylglutathione lyase family enzyme
MALQLSMVGLVVEDMGRSLAFYRRLGVEVPAGEDDRPHVEVKMENGITFFWDTTFARTYDPDREPPAGGYRMVPEFFLAGRAAVDATYAEMTGHGYQGHRAPFETAFGAYMAMVDDPDGNTVLITAG